MGRVNANIKCDLLRIMGTVPRFGSSLVSVIGELRLANVATEAKKTERITVVYSIDANGIRPGGSYLPLGLLQSVTCRVAIGVGSIVLGLRDRAASKSCTAGRRRRRC